MTNFQNLIQGEVLAEWSKASERLRGQAGELEFAAARQWLRQLWQGWQPQLRIRRLQLAEEAFLALWLDAAVEEAVDREWRSSPGNAFLMDMLAAELCMAALRRVLPELGVQGCAPLPPFSSALREALFRQGLLRSDQTTGGADGAEPGEGLARRYALVTFYPAQGGCGRCALRAGCPKLASGRLDISNKKQQV